jgi:two-component system sensor histidine kinase HydH
VQAEIERIDGIVKELLDFAKPAPLQLQAVSVSKLAEDTLALLSDRCLQQGVQISTSFRENGLTIQADPQQLKQVVLNLFLNSLDAMPKGGRLEVVTQLAADRLALKVSDTGQGIPPDRVHQVWDPFFTTKERGMGLGLAIVKGVVERHGGQIAISSQPGQGTTVQLSLPVNPPEAT